jgi:hypothetical protein
MYLSIDVMGNGKCPWGDGGNGALEKWSSGQFAILTIATNAPRTFPITHYIN